jgi:hypothetical protein
MRRKILKYLDILQIKYFSTLKKSKASKISEIIIKREKHIKIPTIAV